MALSIFIIPKVYPRILQKPNKTKASKKKFKNLKTFCRNTVLLPYLVNKTFYVHNGKNFLRVLVSENIIGHKLGEFSQSRKRYVYKKKKKGKIKNKK